MNEMSTTPPAAPPAKVPAARIDFAALPASAGHAVTVLGL